MELVVSRFIYALVVQILILQTVRVEYDLIGVLAAESLSDVVRAAFYIGDEQVVLAVEPSGVERIKRYFPKTLDSRFSDLDPRSEPQTKRPIAEIILDLTRIHQNYSDGTKSRKFKWDVPLVAWFARDINRLNQLLNYWETRSSGVDSVIEQFESLTIQYDCFVPIWRTRPSKGNLISLLHNNERFQRLTAHWIPEIVAFDYSFLGTL